MDRMSFTLVAALTVTASSLSAETMISDNEVVNIDFDKGLIATWNGSRGKGKFHYTLRKAQNSFGPLQIIEHNANQLTVRGTHTDCTLKKNRTVSCKDGSSGSWVLAE